MIELYTQRKRDGKIKKRTYSTYKTGFHKYVNVKVGKVYRAELWVDGIRVLQVTGAK